MQIIIQNSLVKFIILLFPMLILCYSAEAQYNESIRSARPGQAFGPFTTGKNIFQVQTGTEFAWASSDLSELNNFAYNLSLRYGISEHIELRTASSFQRLESRQGGLDEEVFSGLGSWVIGARFNIKDGERSAFSIQPEVIFNVGIGDFSVEDPIPQVRLLYAQKLNDLFGLTTNLGVAYANSNAILNYVVNLSFPIAGKFSSFIEVYGLYDDDFFVFFDTGLAYLVTNDLQLDLTVGLGKNMGIRTSLLDLGVSWRTKSWKNE